MFSVSAYAEKLPPKFTLQNGFTGLSVGDGTLKLFFGKKKKFHVESHGYEISDGSFRLDQTITFKGKQAQKRHWIVTAVNSNNFLGTLSDASGSVNGNTHGSRLVLKYRIKGPLVMHQTLDLMPDGKTIDNVGKITLFGIPIGHLKETITRKHEY